MNNFVVYETKALVTCLVATILGGLLMLVVVGTDYWVIVDIPQPWPWVEASGANMSGHHSGIWRLCRRLVRPDNRSTATHDLSKRYEECTTMQFYPSQEVLKKDKDLDETILNYSRAETAFSMISIMLMGIGYFFSAYSIKETRYMFKRLAAVLHFLTAIGIMIAVEVFIRSIGYERTNFSALHPSTATFRFGFSFALAWVVFSVFVISGLVFLWFGRKLKGRRAGSRKRARENEPVILGRI